MKKLILSLSLACTFFIAAAQKKITEGVATYDVEYKLPENMQQYAAMFPKEMKVYFKGDSSSMKSESQMSSTTNIMNAKTEYQRLLVDVPMAGKKYSVIFTPDDLDKMEANMPDFAFAETADAQKIGDYNAKKYTVTEKKSNKTFDVWFTKDIDMTTNGLTRFYTKSYGVPVDFTSYQSGMIIKAKLKSIKEEKVPAGVFSASKDYEEITLDQLMQMSGGRR